jgi:hypothetical protein
VASCGSAHTKRIQPLTSAKPNAHSASAVVPCVQCATHLASIPLLPSNLAAARPPTPAAPPSPHRLYYLAGHRIPMPPPLHPNQIDSVLRFELQHRVTGAPPRRLPSFPQRLPVPSSWKTTLRTRMTGGRTSHGAPRLDLVARRPGQPERRNGASRRRRPVGMATGGAEEGMVVAWPRCCCRQPRPRPGGGGGHVSDPAAPDAIHHYVTPPPPQTASTSELPLLLHVSLPNSPFFITLNA